MWYIGIFSYSIFLSLSSSLPMTMKKEAYYDAFSNDNISSIDTKYTPSDICSNGSINIDALPSRTDTDFRIHHDTMAMIYSTLSWQQNIVNDDDHSTVFNSIVIIFTLPYILSNESILNKTVFITDIVHNQLLAVLTDICMNGSSSFIIKYSTSQRLPHNICLYFQLNLTSFTTLRDFIFCRTIDYHTCSSSVSQAGTNDNVGPSGFFILSQCIIILLMMLVIYVVQTARQKSLVNRVSQRLIRSRPYLIIFGRKTAEHANNNVENVSINPAKSLQAGICQLAFHRHLASIPSHPMVSHIEEQVLAANDLTSTIYDRRATRSYISRDLIDIKEFTKRISVPNERSTDSELRVFNNI